MAPEKKPHLQPLSSWSVIPLELAGLVLRLLPAYADRARFAAVCPQWRAAVRQLQNPPVPPPPAVAAARQLLPPSLPLLVLPDGTFYSIPCDKLFHFPGCGFAGYDSTCGSWLVFSRDDGCFLVDPFSREKVTLPALSSVRLRPPNAVAKWSYEHGSSDAYPYYTWMHMEEYEKLHIQKLILCSANLVAALVGVGHCQILICQPGSLSWSVRARDELKMFEDMAFYQGRLYVVTEGEDLLVVNISQDHSTGDPHVSKIGRVIKDKDYPSYYEHLVFRDNFSPHKKLYLVESCGMLLMVRRTVWVQHRELYDDRCIARQSEFEVFEADFEHSRWVKVSSVGGDQVLFLGRSCSRAVHVSRYRLPGDRIFFLDDYAEENAGQYRYDESNTSCSAYDMRLGEVSSPYPMIFWTRCREMRAVAWLFPQD
uniref:Uncharacterized protein n=1 Tax=Avena sativa TaxID=4498 RepID=A0ACD5T7C7_AVESA